MKRKFLPIFKTGFLFLLLITATLADVSAQTYRPIAGWPDPVNQTIKSFLNSTLVITHRKVAVFDCDGTLFGQVPHYLADEALYSYAETHYKGRKDKKSKAKMKIINQMLHGNNTGTDYVADRIRFLSGMTTEEVQRMGTDCFHEIYQSKFYPQMQQLLANLKGFGFEIWVLSAPPELLYQQFVHQETGIPIDHIIGVKSVVQNDTVTSKLVYPIPQDEGKAKAIQTFIKARPLFVGGNSRGDMEMMNQSVGIKLIVNPDHKTVEKSTEAGDMKGYTVKEYWKKNHAIIVHCKDIDTGNKHYVSDKLGIKTNENHPAH